MLKKVVVEKVVVVKAVFSKCLTFMPLDLKVGVGANTMRGCSGKAEGERAENDTKEVIWASEEGTRSYGARNCHI